MVYVVTPNKFNPALLTLGGKIEKTKANGAPFIYVNYNGDRFRLQTPRLPVAYDASDYKGDGKYRVQFSLRNGNTDPKVRKFMETLRAIDKRIIELIAADSKTYLGSANIPVEAITEKYGRSIKQKLDTFTKKPIEGSLISFTNSLRKNKEKDGVFESKLFNSSGNLIEDATPLDVFKRGAESTNISSMSIIWLVKGDINPQWVLDQARIDVEVTGASNNVFQGEDDDDDEESENPVRRQPTITKIDESDLANAFEVEEEDDDEEEHTQKHNDYEESDDEEDTLIEPVPTPVPAAKPKVTRAVKKTTK